MHPSNQKSLLLSGALAGFGGTLAYFIIAFVSLPDNLTFLLAMFFPVGLIIFFYSLREFIKSKASNHFNELSFLFCSFALVIVAVMLSVQIGIQSGIDAKNATDSVKQIKMMLRSIDMGIDVAWDVFISTGMIFLAFATFKLPALKWWGIVNGLLGLMLLVFNILSFPEPPMDAGLMDVGPFIALFWILLQIRMVWMAIRLSASEN
jgi:drug/metabolite transporter (DMT)-like permease